MEPENNRKSELVLENLSAGSNDWYGLRQKGLRLIRLSHDMFFLFQEIQKMQHFSGKK